MSRHLLIAGTGRSGTSFLVRYLTRLGLDTTLSRGGDAAHWDDAAQAGLEDIIRPGAYLPYVIKSPWTFQVIHDVLARGEIQFDAVVIPLRDLAEAAASRAILEAQAMHRAQPWLSTLDRAWELFGHTPGGMVISLNPVDQARLLAVGFHQLVHRLVQADVPLVLLDFPRMVEDADYLARKLMPVLPHGITAEAARLAHSDVADPAKVRVGRELREQPEAVPEGLHVAFPGPEKLERAAVLRLLTETRRDLQAARDEVAGMTLATRMREASLTRAREELQQSQSWVANAQASAVASAAQRDALVQRLAAAENALTTAKAEANDLRIQLQQENAEAGLLLERLTAIETSEAWLGAMALARAPRLAGALSWLLPKAARDRRPRSAGRDP